MSLSSSCTGWGGGVPVRVVVHGHHVAFLDDAVLLGEVLLGEGLVGGGQPAGADR